MQNGEDPVRSKPEEILEVHAAPCDLDIQDLHYVTSSEKLGLENYKPTKRWRKALPVQILFYLYRGLRSMARLLGQTWGTRSHRSDLLAITWTVNQNRAVLPVTNSLPSVTHLTSKRNLGGDALLPEALAYAESLLYLPQTLKQRRMSTGYQRRSFDLHFARYWLTFGYYRMARRLLKHHSPKLVLLSNDHNMESRTFLHGAQQLGIRSAYIQHATVSGNFPPLGFDLVLLDGLDAAKKYDQATEHTPAVFLIGSPKADHARSSMYVRTSPVSKIGVCLNLLDPIPAVKTFLQELSSRDPSLKFAIRPHPADNRPWRQELEAGYTYSDAVEEPPFDFLARVDAILSGPSSIILEAALVGVRPVYVDFGELKSDQYGFLASGLCKQARNVEEALELLMPVKVSELDDQLNYYFASIGTDYDGRSSELAQDLITEFLGEGLDFSRWQRASGFTHIDVFVLKKHRA